MSIRRLLVPTDFSSRSERALRYAIALARTLSATIDVLHVVPPPHLAKRVLDANLGRPLPTVPPELVDEAERRLARLIGDVPHEEVHVGTLVEVGDPAATIVRLAAELPADLVVTATHARSGVSEMLLGSVAHRVITCAPCPVVTLRGDEAGG